MDMSIENMMADHDGVIVTTNTIGIELKTHTAN